MLPVLAAASAGPDWGSVPDWIGGLGTTLALLWGVYVLSHDRRQAERAQATKVLVFRLEEMDAGLKSVTIQVQNESEQAILYPELVRQAELRSHLDGRRLNGESALHAFATGKKQLVKSGERFSFAQPPHTKQGDNLFVRFTDAAGIRWQHDLATHQVRRVKMRARRLLGAPYCQVAR